MLCPSRLHLILPLISRTYAFCILIFNTFSTLFLQLFYFNNDSYPCARLSVIQNYCPLFKCFIVAFFLYIQYDYFNLFLHATILFFRSLYMSLGIISWFITLALLIFLNCFQLYTCHPTVACSIWILSSYSIAYFY